MQSSAKNVYNLSEVSLLAKKILEDLSPNIDFATVLALKGDLGSGKTTFTQFLAQELGIKEQITSPTFVIEKIYSCDPNQKFKKLVHIDCYRLNSTEEMLRLGWEEIVGNSENLIVVEWPERIGEILPTNTKIIDFEFVDEGQRRIEVRK